MKRFTLIAAAILMMTVSANAQGLGGLLGKLTGSGDTNAGSIVSSITDLLSGKSALSPETIAGNWNYTGSAISFKSDNNPLSNIASTAAQSTIEKKLDGYLQKVGISQGLFGFTFNEDGTMAIKYGSKSFPGTWTLDQQNATLNMKVASLINMKGEEIIPLQYDKAAFDGYGKALALGKIIGETDDEEQYQYGFWDLEGHQLSDMVFSDVEANIFGYILQIDGKTYYTMSFNEGLTPFFNNDEDEESIVEESSLFGYLDRQGRVAIKPQFSSAEPFSDGLAAVGLPNDDGNGELYGYIDTSGKMVVPAIYSVVAPFVAGLGVVRTTDGEVIVIDKQGNHIMDVPGYDAEIIVDDNGLGLTRIKVTGYDDNVKYYDRTGKLIKMLVDGEYLYPRP